LATTIRPLAINHMNVVLENFDASIRHLQDAYDATFVLDIRSPEMHAGLFEVGRVLFEMFVPNVYLLNSRYGPHYVGVEYQAEMDVVRAAVAERGMRIVREYAGSAIHTHPADGFGVSFEFYHEYFPDWEWEKQDGGAGPGTSLRSAEHWLAHPMGLNGQKGYTHAVHDIDAASAFMQSFLAGEPIYEAERPALSARAVGLKVADIVVELVTPTGEGELARHLYRYGEGIRSTVFGVSNVDRARRHLADRGLPTIEGGAPGSFAVPAEANLGLIFEFAE
jgi:hypothetical protein